MAGSYFTHIISLYYIYARNPTTLQIYDCVQMLCDDELPTIRKPEGKPKKKPRKEVRFAPLPTPVPPLPKSQTEATPREVCFAPLPTPIPPLPKSQTEAAPRDTDLTPTIAAKKLVRQKSSNQHYLSQPRTLFNDSLHYLLVVGFILVFCVLQLHPKS